jgi:predicted DNA binding CopG/RHH family protein
METSVPTAAPDKEKITTLINRLIDICKRDKQPSKCGWEYCYKVQRVQIQIVSHDLMASDEAGQMARVVPQP